MADFYADFTRTDLAGRIAQGMALLLLEERGYSYAGRCSAVLQRHASKSKSKTLSANREKLPDFIVENSSMERALAEAKGGFVATGEKPNIKGALKEALLQLDNGGRLFKPQPRKAFAVGTFLREKEAPSDETSLIAFVDPEPDESLDPIEIPPDAVRRANYASWLAFMGFGDAARRLLRAEGEPQRRSVPVITVRGNEYVVTIASVWPRASPDVPDHELWQEFLEWPHWPYGPFSDGLSVEIIGLKLDIMRSLGVTSRADQSKKLMGMHPAERPDFPAGFEGEGFYGSVFSDGSLLGEVRMRRDGRSVFQWREIEL